jgi:hypothetical protein
MIKINEIVVLKDGFLIKASGIEDQTESQLIKTFLLVFNQSRNHIIVTEIAEHINKKEKKCSQKYLLEKLGLNRSEIYNSFYYDLIKSKRRLQSKNYAFTLYKKLSRKIRTEEIEDIKIRDEFIQAFIQCENKPNGSEKGIYYWLGDSDTTEIKFKTTETVTSFGAVPPKDIKKESDEKVKSKIQQQDEKEDTKNALLEKVNNLDTDFNYAESLLEALPALPQYEVVGRKNDIIKITEILKKAIHCNEQRYKNKLCIIHGLPGVGKTTLSIVLSHDKHIQSLFKDGIIWTALGMTPDLLILFHNRALPLNSKELKGASSIEEAELILSKLLRKRNFLIVVDDVWNLRDIKPFLRLSKNTTTILTTRLTEIAYLLTLNPEEIHKLDILSDAESLRLLKELVPSVLKKHPTECKELVNALEGLPLAIRVAGHLLRKQNEYGLSVPNLLRDLKEGRQLLEAKPPGDMRALTTESSPTVAALLKRSTDSLTSQARKCFSFLAHLPSRPARLKLQDLVDVWDVDDPENIAKELLDFGLIEPLSEEGIFSIHYLMILLADSLFTD